MSKHETELAAALAEAAAATQAEQAAGEELIACKEEAAAMQQDLMQWPTAWYENGQKMHASKQSLWVTSGNVGLAVITASRDAPICSA